MAVRRWLILCELILINAVLDMINRLMKESRSFLSICHSG